MSKKILLPLIMVLIPIAIIVGLVVYTAQQDIAILHTGGEIASRQRELLVFAFLLSLVVLIPVFILILVISIRYRAGNKKAKYKPDWAHSNTLEIIWWGIPVVIILILSIITWRTSHTLDPYKKLDHDVEPINVQVLALQWKWLFMYPDHNIATVNHLYIPENTPINFSIAADAPMNSFWVPKLGGQIYAMNGMSTKLHLIADKPGIYRGLSANISGEGFAKMQFEIEAVSADDFNNWLSQAKLGDEYLDLNKYNELAHRDTEGERLVYSGFVTGLYDTIIFKYMPEHAPAPEAQNEGSYDVHKTHATHGGY